MASGRVVVVTERPSSFVVFSDENSVGFAQTTIKAAEEKLERT